MIAISQRRIHAGLLILIFAACGCSQNGSISDPESIANESSPVGEPDADTRGSEVDPAVDAGMMADEFERNDRVNPKR